MILRCNYEEVEALRGGARALLRLSPVMAQSNVLAPPETRARVEWLLPRLKGDLSAYTIEDQRAVQAAVEAIVEHLEEDMQSAVLEAHPAAEDAVNAYFAFAHALTVLERVREMGEEMTAIVELVTGDAPSPETMRTFRFPD